MQRFILQENIKSYRALLDAAIDPVEQRRFKVMLAAVERELALLVASEAGAGARPWPLGAAADRDAAQARFIDDFRSELGASEHVAYLIDPSPGLIVVEVNWAFERATGLARAEVVGHPLFQLFPDNPDNPDADGMAQLYASLRRVAETGRPHAMPIMRYDVRDTKNGAWIERYWRQVNSPLHDDAGRLVLLLHIVDEVTEEVRKADERLSTAGSPTSGV